MSSSILFKINYWGATNNWREKIKGRSKQVNQTQAPSLSHNPPISRTFYYTLWYAEQLVFNQYQKKRTKQKNNFNPRCMLWEYQTLVASLNGSYNGNVRARIPILEMMQQPTGNWVRSYEQTKMDNYIWRGNYLCFNLHLSLQHHPFLNFLSRLCHIIVTRSHSSPVCKGN